MTANLTTAIQAENLVKSYNRGTEQVKAVDDISFEIYESEFVAIVGPSGAGKTSLLQLVGCMDTPTSGKLMVAGNDVTKMNDRGLTQLRRKELGFVFQHFGLMPTLNVVENIALPAMLSRRDVRSRVDELLERVQLTQRRNHRPSELSGGEMQRVAIARALINRPRILLADEPTGNLDSATSETILNLLHELRQDGLTLIVVTHNETLASTAERIITMRDGKIV